MITTKRIIPLCLAICLTAALSACGNTSEITETSAASFENHTIIPKPMETESETKTETSVMEDTEQSDEPIDFKSNDEYEYFVYADHISICEYLGSDSEVVVPAEIDGLPVTVLEVYAFGGNDTLTRVELPDSLITIGDSAFKFCKNLKSVVIPESVSVIDELAFCFCESLESIAIPKNVSVIGFSAFDGCGITEVTFADGVEEIGEEAFFNCENLEKVILPNTVKIIGEGAFADCTSLEKAVIPDSVTELGDGAFCDCENLIDVSLPDSFDELTVKQAFIGTLWYEENFGTSE